MTLRELIEKLGGKIAAGDAKQNIAGVNSVEQASSAELVFAEDAASATKALASNAGVVVLRAGLVESYPQGKSVVEADQPRLWFARAGQLLAPKLPATGVHPAAVVGVDVKLGEGVSIGPCAVVGENAVIGARTRIEAGAIIGAGVQIGSDCRIYPRAVLYPGTTLGNRVMVHAGAVLGADGFGYVRDEKSGAYTQFPQQGTLLIEDDDTVREIGVVQRVPVTPGVTYRATVSVKPPPGASTGGAILLLSLAVGGVTPWLAYLDFLRSSAQAVHLVVPLNIGPAAQIAMLFGGSETTARLLQFFVTPLAIGLTILAALRFHLGLTVYPEAEMHMTGASE